jgi:hypothetical protein
MEIMNLGNPQYLLCQEIAQMKEDYKELKDELKRTRLIPILAVTDIFRERIYLFVFAVFLPACSMEKF